MYVQRPLHAMHVAYVMKIRKLSKLTVTKEYPVSTEPRKLFLFNFTINH